MGNCLNAKRQTTTMRRSSENNEDGNSSQQNFRPPVPPRKTPPKKVDVTPKTPPMITKPTMANVIEQMKLEQQRKQANKSATASLHSDTDSQKNVVLEQQKKKRLDLEKAKLGIMQRQQKRNNSSDALDEQKRNNSSDVSDEQEKRTNSSNVQDNSTQLTEPKQRNQPVSDSILAASAVTARKYKDYRSREKPEIESFEQIDTILIALYHYESHADGDLSMRKGDQVLLIDSSDRDWLYVRHLITGYEGYVPRTFTAEKQTIESEDWFAGQIQRNLAAQLVMESRLPKGTFLIRERIASIQEYALTIKDSEHENTAKHYRIKRMDSNSNYYIANRRNFANLQELVQHYQKNADGLCCKLTIPAPRHAPARPDLSHETQSNFEIPRHQLVLTRKLGNGNFGDVFYGKWQGQLEVAVKTMKEGTMSREGFLAEAMRLKRCKHPNLIKLYAVCTKEEPLYIVTEYMKNGALLHFLREGLGSLLALPALTQICAQVANGMTYLEEINFVHRDLAARNILVGDVYSGVPVVKIADFGLARVLYDEDSYIAHNGAKFPIKWTAPEAALKGKFTVKSDVWSYGVLMYEIVTKGHNPYPGMPNIEVVPQVHAGHRMTCPKDCPEPIYDLMSKCWDENPEKRPTFEFLFAFFDDYQVSAQQSYMPPE